MYSAIAADELAKFSLMHVSNNPLRSATPLALLGIATASLTTLIRGWIKVTLPRFPPISSNLSQKGQKGVNVSIIARWKREDVVFLFLAVKRVGSVQMLRQVVMSLRCLGSNGQVYPAQGHRRLHVHERLIFSYRPITRII
jgi:hypothetical protein